MKYWRADTGCIELMAADSFARSTYYSATAVADRTRNVSDGDILGIEVDGQRQAVIVCQVNLNMLWETIVAYRTIDGDDVYTVDIDEFRRLSFELSERSLQEIKRTLESAASA